MRRNQNVDEKKLSQGQGETNARTGRNLTGATFCKNIKKITPKTENDISKFQISNSNAVSLS